LNLSEPKYFGRVKGGMTLHCEDVEGISVRFILGYFGEDPAKLIAAFWKEQEGAASFQVVPVFAYGEAPRSELCTQQSLAAALQSVTLERDGIIEKKWKELAEEFDVTWRLRPRNRPETEQKAINEPVMDSA
jgi:hypothetical protein